MTEQVLTAFLESKKDALSPVVHEFGQVRKMHRTLFISFMQLPEAPDGQEEMANDLHDLPFARSLNVVEFLHF